MPKNGFVFGNNKVVQASYTLYDYLPKMYRHYGDGILRENGEIAEFDIWADDWETLDYYKSVLELGEGIFAGDSNPEPTETLRESVLSHQQMKTTKKSNKKRSWEQRAKKKSNRIDKIPDLEVEEAGDLKDRENWARYAFSSRRMPLIE